jgi:hypothetical protein
MKLAQVARQFSLVRFQVDGVRDADELPRKEGEREECERSSQSGCPPIPVFRFKVADHWFLRVGTFAVAATAAEM